MYIECSYGFVFVNTTKHNTIRTDHNFEQEIFMYNSISRHLHTSMCVSVFNLASDTIAMLVFVCLSVCVFVRICVSTDICHTSLNVGRLLSKNIQEIGERS